MSEPKPRRPRHTASKPAASSSVPGGRKLQTIDVRPMLERGEEPFFLIMQTAAALAAGDRLVVVTPFLPSPLIERLHAEGFSIQPERQLDGSWQTQFVRPE